VARKQKRLQWYNAASDAELAKLYADSTCLIAASLDEGFGLPLIEAAHFDLPIIARDIPVFREVGGGNATYFSAENADELADVVKQWLVTWKQGRAPGSSGINSISWRQSADKLMAVLGDDQAAQSQVR
jgi:glycosyltransferase involved in cell wall biosynthesis